MNDHEAAGELATRPAGQHVHRHVPVVGMVGAGQLARMTCQAAVGLGIGFRVLAAAPDESAAQVCAGTELGDYRSLEDLTVFGGHCDVLTFDHEHVPGPHLRALERAGAAVRPGPDALAFAQDKSAMRERLAAMGISCPRYARVAAPGDVTGFADSAGWPVVLKAVRGGYDGKGVWVCATADEAAAVLALGIDLMVEEHVAFERELAVLVARSPSGQGAAYPVVQTVQRDGICREVLAPAPGLPDETAQAAEQIGLAIAAGIGVTGLLAVELFETPGGLLVNELAMRPHNSGHWTIEGARTSQFEQHLRAVLDLPLGAPVMAARQAVMVNILGGGDPDLYSRLVHVMAADPGVKIHLYGKEVRPGRKVGHVTAVGDDLDDLRGRAARAANYLRHGTEDEPAAG
ncbi:MAG TPA: 5-(carboxyamino)imidazole ribonucleotide synthase [Streptosporangiaceae bacterium]|nr:5-(carboxyamino)imidazole ribonucleotide synthase [Streptosporangiaceae bacterium]